ncbi:hypothetical protein R3P38DRAFT_1365189 [Favolaschia claudopus]|uniref:F-box domain-containing protein n=1 Tax=Favolaschia claudopus TaxID=2862362 RepID=A0AAW0DW33_9AGAR
MSASLSAPSTCASKPLSLPSSVNRTPPELLSKIFRLTHPHDQSRNIGSNVVHVPPWRLSHVSRSWRYAARGDASLWTFVKINAAVSDYHNDKSCVNTELAYPLASLESQLALSCNLPLTVEFYAKCREDRNGFSSMSREDAKNRQNSKHVRALLDILVQHSPRWESLTIDGSDYIDVFGALSVARDRLDRLARLSVTEYDLSIGLADVFANAPSLREFEFPRAIEDRQLLISIPWHQLVKLFGKSITPKNLLRILPQTPNLVECVFSGEPGWASFPDHPYELAVLPHLRRFRLVSRKLAVCVTAPHLEDFGFLLVSNAPPALTSFLQQHGTHLHTLKLTSSKWRCPKSTLLDIFRQLPQLIHLELDTDNGYDYPETYQHLFNTLFRGMTVLRRTGTKQRRGPTQPLCPNLQSIRIESIYDVDWVRDYEGEYSEPDNSESFDRSPWSRALCDFLESRWTVTPLESVHLSPCKESLRFFPEEWERLEALRLAGLDLQGHELYVPQRGRDFWYL